MKILSIIAATALISGVFFHSIVSEVLNGDDLQLILLDDVVPDRRTRVVWDQTDGDIQVPSGRYVAKLILGTDTLQAPFSISLSRETRTMQDGKIVHKESGLLSTNADRYVPGDSVCIGVCLAQPRHARLMIEKR